MITKPEDVKGLKVTVMGLGLHGGGLAVTQFLCELGAEVTVTDLSTEEILQSTLEKIKDYKIRLVLGKHENEDFSNADLVIKNPGVPKTSKYLKIAKQVETDISLFIRFTKNPLFAITGSKGKSTTVSALYHILSLTETGAFLGGNITVSPLTFYKDALNYPQRPVILELSSWQLADLPQDINFNPEISMITNIMTDHQNTYNSMDEYAQDKERIFINQSTDKATVFNIEDSYTDYFLSKLKSAPYFISGKRLQSNQYGAWIENNTAIIKTEKENYSFNLENEFMLGIHNKLNLLHAALCSILMGTEPIIVQKGLMSFSGIAHRLEKIHSDKSIDIYNDSAATIPDATAAAVKSFKNPVVLITGGTDKEIDFSVVAEYAAIPKHIVLLKGNASDKMLPYFQKEGTPVSGPFDSLKNAVEKALDLCGKDYVLIFSPGATSFGMFLNEFDRGNQFKELIEKKLK